MMETTPAASLVVPQTQFLFQLLVIALDPPAQLGQIDQAIEWYVWRKGGKPPCCMDRGCGRTEPDPCSGSCNADVLRTSQLQHSVQHVSRDGHLARLSPVGLEAQAVTDDPFPSRDVGLPQSAPVVPRHPLPAHAAALGDTS